MAQAVSSWEVLGSTHVYRGAVSHCGVCLKSAVTTLVYLELCFLNSFCFVIFYFIFFFFTTTGWPISREWVTNLSFYHYAVCYRKYEGGFNVIAL